MHLLPYFMGQADAMKIMRNLHLNYSWMVTLLAVGSIVVGFISLTYRMSMMVRELDVKSGDLKEELERRSQSETAYRASEQRFRRLYDDTPVMLHSIDREGRLTSVNNHWLDTLGYERAEVIGHRSTDFLDEESRQFAFDVTLPKFYRTGEVKDVPYRFVKKGGGTVDILLSGFAERDKNGDIVGSRAALIDVTQRNRAEADALEARRILFSAIDHMPDGFAVFDEQDQLILCNDQYKSMYPKIGDLVVPGARFSDLAAMASERGQFVEYSPRDKNEELSELGQEEQAGEDNGQTLTAEGRWIESRDQFAEKIGRVAIRIDITERKSVEDALRLRNRAIEASADGVLIADARAPDLPIVYANPAIERVTGYAVHELIGRNCRFLQGEERDQPELDRIREAVHNKQPGDAIIRNFRKDGSLFWNELHVAPVRDNAGEVTHFVGIQKDVTERKQAEDQRRQAQKMEAVGQLTGGVAHDFNNLLAIIIGNAEMLVERIGNPDELAQSINRAASRGASLTKRLLAFSRRQSLRPQAIDVEDLIAGMAELLHPTLGETIELKTSRYPGLWQIMADPGELENALLNLAINARDAMPDGGTLTVESSNVELPEGDLAMKDGAKLERCVMLEVRDSGSGMAPNVLQRVFEPFFTTKEVGEGSGLGLSMVYGFVKQTGGYVTVQSEEGSGTSVKLYLPRAESAGAKATRDVEKEGDTAKVRGKTILVVEDDTDVRKMIVRMLRDLDCEICEAGDGKVALALLEDTPRIDLLLTDIVLPGGMAGPELAEWVLRRCPTTRVLYMSGYSSQVVDKGNLFDNSAGILNKPFRKRKLLETVRKALTEPNAGDSMPIPIASYRRSGGARQRRIQT